jgi:hypothetical protein
VKCSESLSNRVSNVIRRYEYVDNMKFAAYMAFYFTIFLYVLMVVFFTIYGCMFCTLLSNFVSYVFLLCMYVYILLSSCQMALFGYAD